MAPMPVSAQVEGSGTAVKSESTTLLARLGKALAPP